MWKSKTNIQSYICTYCTKRIRCRSFKGNLSTTEGLSFVFVSLLQRYPSITVWPLFHEFHIVVPELHRVHYAPSSCHNCTEVQTYHVTFQCNVTSIQAAVVMKAHHRIPVALSKSQGLEFWPPTGLNASCQQPNNFATQVKALVIHTAPELRSTMINPSWQHFILHEASCYRKTIWRPPLTCALHGANSKHLVCVHKTFRGTAVLPVRASASHILVTARRSRVWSAAGRHSTNKQAYPGHRHRRHPTKHHAHGQWPRKWASEALASPGC